MDAMEQLFVNAFLGGVILGAMASMKMWLSGGVLGCSGSLKAFAKMQGLKPILFVLGITSASFAARWFAPQALRAYEGLNLYQMFGVGLVVGVGTFLANGCTSGHGITGVSRLAKRSLTATVTFLVSGMATATVFHTREWVDSERPESVDLMAIGVGAVLLAVLLSLVVAGRFAAPKVMTEHNSKLLVELILSFGFGLGLIFSGMGQAANVLDFLDLRADTWNPALTCVLGGAVLVKALIYHSVTKNQTEALLGGNMSLPCCKKRPDRKLVVGSVLFGVGYWVLAACALAQQ